MPARRSAFTLIELLVVIAITALLIGILLPALGLAQRRARGLTCETTLKQVGVALTAYAADHAGLVVPSYNMTGTSGTGVPLDGWGPILEHDGYLSGVGESQLRRSPLACPEARDVSGLLTGQTGNDPDNPRGWMEWPTMRTGAGFTPQSITDRGFEKILKVAYWINGDNPIGAATLVSPDTYYTGSVGYGPGTNGVFIRPTRDSAFVRPHTLIAAADGVYAGRQRDNRIGSTNCRIGYRHPPGSPSGAAAAGNDGSANAVFADGHVKSLRGSVFPRASAGAADLEAVRAENRNGQPTVFADPARALGL